MQTVNRLPDQRNASSPAPGLGTSGGRRTVLRAHLGFAEGGKNSYRRALYAGTDIIVMDEAFSALDPLIRAGLQTEVLALQAETGRTIVFVTHDLDEALRLGHRLAILHEGRVLQVGTPDELLMQPADDHVAAFVRGVNRARAWTIGAALAPWPPHLALLPLEDAVDDTLTIEQVLPRLAGRAEALAVRRGGRIAGCVDVDKLQRMLDQRGPWRAPERPPSTDDLVRAQQQIARQHQADGVGSRPV